MGRKWRNGYRSRVKKPERAGDKSHQEVQKQGIRLGSRGYHVCKQQEYSAC